MLQIRKKCYYGSLSPPAVEYLQCSADIISSVPQMDTVPPEVIFTIQHLVAKSLEATWYCYINLWENVIAHKLLFQKKNEAVTVSIP